MIARSLKDGDADSSPAIAQRQRERALTGTARASKNLSPIMQPATSSTSTGATSARGPRSCRTLGAHRGSGTTWARAGPPRKTGAGFERRSGKRRSSTTTPAGASRGTPSAAAIPNAGSVTFTEAPGDLRGTELHVGMEWGAARRRTRQVNFRAPVQQRSRLDRRNGTFADSRRRSKFGYIVALNGTDVTRSERSPITAPAR